MAYFNYDVNVDYSTALESVSEFPAVTICNLNPFDLTKSSDTTSYLIKILLENNISPRVVLNTSDEAFYSINRISTLLKSYVTSDQSISSSFKEAIGFTMSDMLVSCYFNGIACNSSHFKYFRTYDYGNCYTFNYDPDNVYKMSQTGKKNIYKCSLFS